MTETRAIRSVLIPLQEGQLLLPNAAVAEVADFISPEPISSAPEWLLGQISWREQDVPLVSFERVMGLDVEIEPHRRTRIAIFYTLRGDKALPYIGMVSHGIPHLVQVSEKSVTPAAEEKALPPRILRRVLIDEVEALIPDLEALEEQVVKALEDVDQQALGGA